MTILANIRLLVGIHLGQKGFSSDITSPVLRILSLIDEELVSVGYDFMNPAIEKEVERLEDAIEALGNLSDEPITPHKYNLGENGIIEHEQLNNFGNIIELGFTEESDDLSYLDEDDGN